MTYIEGKAYNNKAMETINRLIWAIVARLVEQGHGCVGVETEVSYAKESKTSFAVVRLGIPGRYHSETRHFMVQSNGNTALLNAKRAAKWDGTPDYRPLILPGDIAVINAPTY